MKAIVSHIYGSSDVLKPKEMEAPTVKEDEAMVGVDAASANPGDSQKPGVEQVFLRLTGFGFL